MKKAALLVLVLILVLVAFPVAAQADHCVYPGEDPRIPPGDRPEVDPQACYEESPLPEIIQEVQAFCHEQTGICNP